MLLDLGFCEIPCLMRVSSVSSFWLLWLVIRSSNAIHHLASEEHLRNVRDFLRKHGGGMDRVDSFRVSEAELLKVSA